MNWSQQPSRNYQVLYRGPCFSFFLFDRKKSDHAVKRRKREKKKMSSSSGQMVHCLPPNDPHQDWVRRLCRVRGCGADRSRRRRRRRRHPTVSGGFLLAHGYRQSTSTLISPSAIGSPPPSLSTFYVSGIQTEWLIRTAVIQRFADCFQGYRFSESISKWRTRTWKRGENEPATLTTKARNVKVWPVNKRL